MGFEVTTANRMGLLGMDSPRVHPLRVAGSFDLADVRTEAGRDPEVAVVILSAAGKGFNAGVDIKEMQNTEGFDALIGANRGCAAAFGAIYDCEVPVICAVHDFVLGGGIGLIGNADVIVAAEGTTIGLPEVKQGALGAATHLSRLVPPHRMRQMVYTAEPIDVSILHEWGSVAEVVPRDELLATAERIAEQIARHSNLVIRAAKESLNAIDPVDVRRSYRMEQGFTFELNLSGVSDEARDAFVEKRDPTYKR